jgi:prephenate dehydrogenase
MTRSPLPRISIIGIGLMGGSLGKALISRLPEAEVVGYDDPQVLKTALDAQAITEPADSLREAVSDADIVVVAVPLRAIPAVMQEVGTFVKAGALVTDVASVKTPIVELAESALPDNVRFVGGHPMAGSASGGIDAADALLFENVVYVLTPVSGRIPDEAAPLIHLVETIGGRVLVMTPEVHDRVAAAVSHLPQLMSVALVEAAFEFGADRDLVSTLAAGGFRDMTRVAESPFRTWEGILAANHGNVLDALAVSAAVLQRLRNRLIEEDYAGIQQSFERAATNRRSIPTDMRGFISPVHHLSVALEDRPGTLHQLTGVLYDAGINIKDVELVKIREGAAGSFRIGFSSAEDSEAARLCLVDAGFRVTRA